MEKEHAPLLEKQEATPTPAAPAAARSRPRRGPRRRPGNQAMQRLLQAKLAVGRANDRYEEEADHVAERVSGGVVAPAPPITPLNGSPPPRRTCACGRPLGPGGECQACGRKRQALQGSAMEAAPTPEAADSVERTLQRSAGEPLPAGARRFFEARFGRDFGGVRVHTNGEAAASARRLGARAYTVGEDLVFETGEFAPETPAGRRLLAHELTHVVQQRQGADGVPRDTRFLQRNPDDASGTDTELSPVALELVDAVRERDVPAVAAALRGHTVDELRALRQSVRQELQIDLAQWLIALVSGGGHMQSAFEWGSILLSVGAGGLVPAPTVVRQLSGGQTEAAEEALRLLWPTLSLLDRLDVYDEVFREIEAAQLDVIRAASQEERAAALEEGERLEAIYRGMDPKQEYDARLLMEPDARYQATVRLLARAEGVFWDEEDAVFDAILRLSPADRSAIYLNEYDVLQSMLTADQLALVRTMTVGQETGVVGLDARSTEAQSLMARLRLATEGRIDDAEGIQTVVDRATELLMEQRRLRAQQAAPDIDEEARAQIEARLREIGDLEALMRVAPAGEAGREQTFMGRLEEAAGSSQQFGQWARRLQADPFEAAKRQILMSAGTFGVDHVAIEAALVNLRAAPVTLEPGMTEEERERRQTQANNELRQALLQDDDVRAVLERLEHQGPGGYAYRRNIESLAEADRFQELMGEFADAVSSYDYGEIFRLALVFARNPDWAQRFRRSGEGFLTPLSRISGEPREIINAILQTREMPVEQVLAYTGDVETLRTALSQLDEERRGQLRLGYWLSRERPAEESLTNEAREALNAFATFENQLRESQSTLGIVDRRGVQDVLDAVLGGAPTEAEMQSGAGRLRAAGLLFHRQRERQALERGLVTPFTETDEAAAAAAREFAARWEQVRRQGELSATDFAALAALHDRYEQRAQEFTEASQSVSEVASMVAATVAAVVVVAATGGAATPGVLAAVAAAGAGSRVLTREMFGGDYYDPAGEEGARDALLGAIDGALAVVGGSLATRGAELVGLGGRALTAGAARLGAQAAEQAGQSLGRRVATGAVEAAIDGLFSGTVSEAVATMTDARTWRRGVWQGLVSVGQSALLGGLTGLGTGVVAGTALPALGAGAGRLRQAAAANSLERAVARGGREAQDIWDAAQRAAREGREDEARRLLSRLEEREGVELTGEQARLLRAQLDLDGHGLPRPEGTVHPAGARQAQLLEESRAVTSGENLTQAQLDAELSVVRRSQTQPSSEPGYVDEVDLGNGHFWRRREDGTWCRFSGERSLCGTRIPGVRSPRESEGWQDALLNPRSAYYNPEAVERINRLLERVRALDIDVDMEELAAALAQFRGRGRPAARINHALDVIEAEFDRLVGGGSGAPTTVEELRPHLPAADVDEAAEEALAEAVLGGPGELRFGGRPVVLTGVGNEIQTSRTVLRDRLVNQGLEPSWAAAGADWNAHHIIPWEHQYHGVFDVLRANGGWDHNIVANGIGLPTRPGIPGAEHLPVHQLPGPGRYHPIYNQDVGRRLDQLLEQYGSDPAQLRQEVTKLLEDLRGELEAGGHRNFLL